MRRALFPGTFDPPTNGHVDIINRSLRIFDEVVVLISVNYRKECLLTLDERKALFNKIFKDECRVIVDSYDGLVADYAREHSISFIVRGVRNISDFSYEFEMSLNNRTLNHDLDVVFLPSGSKSLITSSSQVREISRYRGDISAFVPECVLSLMKEKNKVLD